MECLWHYINSQGRGELSAEKTNRQQPQTKQEEGLQQDVDYHTMTASSSRMTAVTDTAIGENTRESIAGTTPQLPPTPPLFNNLHEYFKPVFDQLDELNKLADSLIEEENNRGKEKKKK
jgi:hypothetical protein